MASAGEYKIAQILNKEGIDFCREKIFSDIYTGRYRFDFYIPEKNILIEYNGEQHYQFIKKFYKKFTDFTKAQERDRRKISYALAKGIKLYIIPYWEINNINNFEDIIQEEFCPKSKFHNDTVYLDYKLLKSN